MQLKAQKSTDMTTKGARRKKALTTELKIAVVGAPGVGKSALVVRFLTKRYIGEYDHQSEMTYRHEISLDGEPPLMLEIRDTCPKNKREYPNAGDLLNWADGLMLVYSITDRNSFSYIRRAKSELSGDIPVHLVANKSDMLHLREVSHDEAEILAKDFECKFSEVSAADQVDQVAELFRELCKDIIASRRKSKQSLLERMLGGSRPYSRGKSDSNLSKD